MTRKKKLLLLAIAYVIVKWTVVGTAIWFLKDQAWFEFRYLVALPVLGGAIFLLRRKRARAKFEPS